MGMPPLADLTLPRAGTGTCRGVLNAHARRLVRDFISLPPASLPSGVRTLHARVVTLAKRLMERDPRPFVMALRQPAQAALLCALAHETQTGVRGQWVRELCFLLLFELAAKGALSAEVVVPLTGETIRPLRSLAANLLVELDPRADRVTFFSGALRVRTPEGEATLDLQTPGEGAWTWSRPYLRIGEGVSLALSDNNPLSAFEAHPDKSGNALSLGGRSAEEWVASLRSAFDLVDDHVPLLGEEMRLVLRTIIPVGFDEERHLSASYQEAVGAVYMTLHPHPMTMVEALVHEFQHNKLNAALAADPLLSNGFSPLFSSPVRPDPRPLHGVVLAVHAFQAVAALYEAMAAAGHRLAQNPGWRRRFRAILRMNRAGAETVLANAQPTPAGIPFFEEMRALDDRFRVYEATHWPDAPSEPLEALPE